MNEVPHTDIVIVSWKITGTWDSVEYMLSLVCLNTMERVCCSATWCYWGKVMLESGAQSHEHCVIIGVLKTTNSRPTLSRYGGVDGGHVCA